MLGGVLLHLLVYLNLELDELLFYFIIDVSLVLHEFIRIVLFLLIRVVNILSIASDMINSTLDHPCWSDILSEGLVPQVLALRGDLRVVQHVLLVHVGVDLVLDFLLVHREVVVLVVVQALRVLVQVVPYLVV